MIRIIIILLFAGIVGGLLAGTLKRSQFSARLLLAFSGAYLLALVVLHLLPELYEDGSSKSGIFILVGFLVQLLLEFFSKGVEHGHLHKEDLGPGSIPLAIYLALCAHAFLEGMPLAAMGNTQLENNFLLGIAIHKIPVAIALFTLLASHGLTRSKTWFYLILFSLMAPVGFLVNSWISEGYKNSGPFQNALLAIVIGIILHVSTTILFESSDNHRFNRYKIIAVLSGFTISWLVFGLA